MLLEVRSTPTTSTPSPPVDTTAGVTLAKLDGEGASQAEGHLGAGDEHLLRDTTRGYADALDELSAEFGPLLANRLLDGHQLT